MLTSWRCGVRRPAIMGSKAISLIEMMIVLSVTTVIIALGLPSIAQWMHAMDVRSSASDLVALLQGARAEALTRQQDVWVTMGDAQGRAVWALGCVNVTPRCPRRLRGIDAPAVRYVQWAASASASLPALMVPLQAGLHMPAQVIFNARGALPGIGGGKAISRIDVVHAADPGARRWVVLLTANGMARLCDPLIAAGQPLSCG